MSLAQAQRPERPQQRQGETHPFFFRRREWRRDAACLGLDQTLFFGVEREGVKGGFDRERIATAKAICGGCPVKEECLDYALYTNERHGIWGGLSFAERRRIRKTRA